MGHSSSRLPNTFQDALMNRKFFEARLLAYAAFSLLGFNCLAAPDEIQVYTQ
jgi:hypothetical protein